MKGKKQDMGVDEDTCLPASSTTSMEVEDLEDKRHSSKEKEKTSKGRFLVLGSVGVGFREKGLEGFFFFLRGKACYLIIFYQIEHRIQKI